MLRKDLDTLDYRILHLLSEDGRMPVRDMAQKLDVTAPTIRSRMKTLEKEGFLKVAGLINPNRHPEMITAIVAMNVRSEGRMDEVMAEISQLPNVSWAGVVAGRYDIMAEVVCRGGKNELYKFTTETILKIGNVTSSETFIIMKSRENWLQLPEEPEKP